MRCSGFLVRVFSLAHPSCHCIHAFEVSSPGFFPRFSLSFGMPTAFDDAFQSAHGGSCRNSIVFLGLGKEGFDNDRRGDSVPRFSLSCRVGSKERWNDVESQAQWD